MIKSAIKGTLRRTVGAVAPLSWRVRRNPALLVLTYHRVLPASHPDRAVEQPGMYVAPETLAMHLRVLKRNFELIHLSEWLQRASSGRQLPKRACCISFDDGWRDNFEFGYPVLRDANVPATIFL